MSRIVLVLLMLVATAGAVVAYGDPAQIARVGPVSCKGVPR